MAGADGRRRPGGGKGQSGATLSLRIVATYVRPLSRNTWQHAIRCPAHGAGGSNADDDGVGYDGE